jgi:II/X family phage/plasmid replication protein
VFDTVEFLVPVKREMLDMLINKSILTQRIDKSSGSIEFEYSNLFHYQSWLYKVIYKLSDEKFVHDPGIKKTQLISGYPHIRFAFSVPKILWGHNLYSASEVALYLAVDMVQRSFEKEHSVKLIPFTEWYLMRLDLCMNFILNSEDEVKNYIRYLQRFDYQRRHWKNYTKTNDQKESLYFSSRHSTFKIYHKGPEFRFHDKKRFVNQLEAQSLYNFANKIIRFEVELKNRLRYIYQEHFSKFRRKIIPHNWNGFIAFKDALSLIDFEFEIKRIVQLLTITKETKPMKSEQVLKVFMKNYSATQARSFYAVFCTVLLSGMAEARKIYSENLMTRFLIAVRAHDISFILTDIKKLDCDLGFPDDFEPVMSSKYYQLPLAA